MARVRIVDVAAAAGVSVSTVSKALAGKTDVGAATRARIRDVAEELGYRPNSAARQLRTGSTRAIGMLTHDRIGRLSLPVLLGAEDAAGAERLSVLLCDSRNDPIRTRQHIQTLLEHGVDGIIALGRNTNDQPSLGDIGVPVAYAYGASENPDDYSVCSDEIDGARQAVELLVGLGRRRIAHITGPPTYAASRRRATATKAVLGEAGLSLVGGDALHGEWTEAWGRTATELLVRRYPDVDAIFCGSDLVARGAMESLRELGRSIPDDVSIIGFDNWEETAAGARPALTTVDMQLEQVGRAAAAGLFDAIAGHARSGLHQLPCRLVVRDSTAPLRI